MSFFYTIFCFISVFFIIQLAPTLYGLPIIEKTRITFQVAFVSAIISLILSLCFTQCINQVGHFSLGFTAATALFLPQPPLPPSIRKRRSKRRPKRDKPAAIEDLEDGNPLSLVQPAATSSPPPLATAPATPSLQVSETILGILFSCSSTFHIHDHVTFQVTVQTMQLSSKVHFKVDASPSNDTIKI